MKRNTSLAARAALAAAFALSAFPALAQSCTNSILNGDYGFTVTGQILQGPMAGPVTGVALTHFDGAGNLTQKDFVVHNGGAPAAFLTGETGTYNVEPDCTGTAVINFPNGAPAIHLTFVVTRLGTEIHTVVSNPGTNITSIGIKGGWPY